MYQESDSIKNTAIAYYQLDFYLKTLRLPFCVKDLYKRVYKRRLGDQYDDQWIDHLSSDPVVVESIHQPFTAQTIIEALLHEGHEGIVRALLRELRRHQIEYSHVYIMGMSHPHD